MSGGGIRSTRVSLVTTAWKATAAWLLDVQRGLGSPSAGLQQAAGRARWKLRRQVWRFRPGCKHAAAFQEWFGKVQLASLDCRVEVARLRVTAAAIAKRASEHDRQRRWRAWQSWLKEGPAQGLGRQHRMTRVAGGWVPSVVGVIPPDVEDPADLPEAALDAWRLRGSGRARLALSSSACCRNLTEGGEP